ncbi:hypothetical protein [Microbacterium sp. EST19A]|uniref:hypothetical protein n=1 Tax=Microbacterium sp. EST19A TaxID=2862681 RepID=UPI001CC0B7C5|nr:hypothetical protein [Microbacterium sp. EST19A]
MIDSADTSATRGGAIATKAYLQIAAFSGVQAVIVVALAPLTPHIAATFPPAYALVAFAQTLMIFTARRFTGVRWSATLAAGLTALICGPFTAIGWLLAVPLLTAGSIFDGIVFWSQKRHWPLRRENLVAGIAVGLGLFIVSLPVMSLEHLSPFILVNTLAARVFASWLGSVLSARLVSRLERVGVHPAHRNDSSAARQEAARTAR